MKAKKKKIEDTDCAALGVDGSSKVRLPLRLTLSSLSNPDTLDPRP